MRISAPSFTHAARSTPDVLEQHTPPSHLLTSQHFPPDIHGDKMNLPGLPATELLTTSLPPESDNCHSLLLSPSAAAGPTSHFVRHLHKGYEGHLLSKQKERDPGYFSEDRQMEEAEHRYGTTTTATMTGKNEGQPRVPQTFLTQEQKNAALLWHFGSAAADLRISIHLTWLNLTVAPLLMDAVMETTDSIEEQVKQLKDFIIARYSPGHDSSPSVHLVINIRQENAPAL